MPDEPPAPFLRLFLALAVPPAVRQAIARAQGRLRRDAPPGVLRWTRPEQFHVTVKFLGDVPPAQLAEVGRSVSGVCAETPALSLSARGVGFFPNAQRPRVVWVAAGDPDGRLAELHQALNRALRGLGSPDPQRSFAGHITLGRFKPGPRPALDPLYRQVGRLAEHHFGDWQAGELEIVRSTLTADGAWHERLAACRLAA